MTRRSHSVVHTIKGRHQGESGKAIKFEVHEIAGEVLDEPTVQWFPFSQVEKVIRQKPNDPNLDELVVSEWILQAKELM